MTTATPEQQRQLLDLQEADNAIRQLEHRRANLPEQQALDEHEQALARIGSDLANARDELDVAGKRQERYEKEIATVDARRKSEEGRMYSGLISSEKEVQALRGELGSLKSRKSDLEDELLEVMERREELDGMVQSLKERHDELTAQLDEMTGARDTAAEGIDADLAARRAQRSEIAGEIADELLGVYEALRDRKKGVAVAVLDGRTCAGCRLELTAIEYEEAIEDAKSGLASCEQCERILVPRSG